MKMLITQHTRSVQGSNEIMCVSHISRVPYMKNILIHVHILIILVIILIIKIPTLSNFVVITQSYLYV